jgi:hypothetical protein
MLMLLWCVVDVGGVWSAASRVRLAVVVPVVVADAAAACCAALAGPWL